MHDLSRNTISTQLYSLYAFRSHARTQVIFRMTTTLLKFGFVMLVVIVGFAMSLYVLLRGEDTFGENFLGLFNAMLGDTDIFGEFSGERYDPVATILLVVYLFIVTIMLLNLLVAILSTSHSKVQDNVKVEFKVSKARIIEHYRLVVEKDLLPAPFNLVQLVADLVKLVMAPLAILLGFLCNVSKVERLCSELWTSARLVFGRIVFWAILGPVAVVGGALLWVVSSFPYAQYAWYTQYKQEKANDKENNLDFPSRAWRCLLIFLWCIPVAPVCLLVLWIAVFFRWIAALGRWIATACQDQQEPRPTPNTSCTKLPMIGSMLRKGPGGVGASKLSKFLEDPMDDMDVRQDEKDRNTTVEHMKLLRNRLESTTKEQLNVVRNDVDELRNDVKEMGVHLQRVLHNVEKQD